VEDYASDAAAMLDFIRRPTIVAGHSLGAVAAAYLGHEPHRFLKALFLEDPPYFFGEAAEFEKSGNAKPFAAVQKTLIEMRDAGAGLGAYLRLAGSAPAAQGGTQADHVSARHLLSAASALMRQDPACWGPAQSTAVFEGFDGDRPLSVPAQVLCADPALGAGMLDGHAKRFLAANPEAEAVFLDGAPHRIHATTRFQPQFFELLDGFLAEQSEG
jgi:pimeloyl-ACP methyl ester carboxylesterase